LIFELQSQKVKSQKVSIPIAIGNKVLKFGCPSPDGSGNPFCFFLKTKRLQRTAGMASNRNNQRQSSNNQN